jgi:hypothetical protein
MKLGIKVEGFRIDRKQAVLLALHYSEGFVGDPPKRGFG